MDVGIRELKQRLSEYLDRAAEGEVIRVTDRGRPKAVLTGIRHEHAIARGIREGWLKPGEPTEPARVQRVSARRRALELLREDPGRPLMSLYVDTSALLKRYLDEPDSNAAETLLLGDTQWFSGRHTYVEVRRNLARAVANDDLVRIRDVFEADWRRTTIVELDEITCRLAADIGEQTGLRSLDSLHLGAATRAGVDVLSFLTFDLRQAQVARQLGFVVLGV